MIIADDLDIPDSPMTEEERKRIANWWYEKIAPTVVIIPVSFSISEKFLENFIGEKKL